MMMYQDESHDFQLSKQCMKVPLFAYSIHSGRDLSIEGSSVHLSYANYF